MEGAMSVELTDADELRFGPGAASTDDAGRLAAWLAERGVEPAFRVEEGRLRIDTLRDLSAEAGPVDPEPDRDPTVRFRALVADGRVRGGWRPTDVELAAGQLADFLEGRRLGQFRFEPVAGTA